MKWDCVERPLSRLFYRYGKFVARHPFPFLIIPLVVAGVLASGFYRMNINTDLEYLYTPENGRAKVERSAVASIFPQNTSAHFDALRKLTSGKYIRIIVTAKDGGSLLRDDIFQDVTEVDKRMGKGIIENEHENVTYTDVCAKVVNDECANNNLILSLTEGMNISVSSLHLTYPVSTINADLRNIPMSHMANIKEFEMPVFIASTIGGVTIGNDSEVLSAKAMQLIYYFRDDSRDIKSKSARWVSSTAKELLKGTYPKINVALITSESLEESIVDTTLGVIPLFAITFAVLITFSIASCMMLNPVSSKPFLGLSGVLSAGLAVISSFGLMCYIGVDFIEIVASTPFLILAIGVDGMFVLLASWRMTDIKTGYEERMAVTFSEAGMSVLITNLTDGLAFAIGAATFYPSVRTFCLYTGVAVFFDFVFQITFFGAVLALTGKREEQNRHSILFCMRVPQNISQEEKKDKKDKKEHTIMSFFQGKYGPVLMKPIAKFIVMTAFIGYLAVAVYGCTQAQEGIDMKNLAEDGSYAVQFYKHENDFFKEFGPAVSIVINKDVDISKEEDFREIKDVLSEFNASPLFGDANITVSWLYEFENYIEKHNLSRSLDTLVNKFFNEPAFQEFESDVVINDNMITSSRYFARSVKTYDSNAEKDMMVTARNMADNSTLNVTVYNPAFVFYDQYVTVLANTLQNIGIATGTMLIVSLILIPNPVCVIWVFLSICTICTGVVGYMTLWGVDLDSIAMINLIMCIGFCVDFCAHITYVYSVSTRACPSERVNEALGYLGYPILQGALSTVIGIVPLAFSKAYTIRAFFKIIFLVIMISAFHGLLVIPVLLSLTGLKSKGDRPPSWNRSKVKISTVSSLVYPAVEKNLPIGDFCTDVNKNNISDKYKDNDINEPVEENIVKPPPYVQTESL